MLVQMPSQRMTMAADYTVSTLVTGGSSNSSDHRHI